MRIYSRREARYMSAKEERRFNKIMRKTALHYIALPAGKRIDYFLKESHFNFRQDVLKKYFWRIFCSKIKSLIFICVCACVTRAVCYKNGRVIFSESDILFKVSCMRRWTWAAPIFHPYRIDSRWGSRCSIPEARKEEGLLAHPEKCTPKCEALVARALRAAMIMVNIKRNLTSLRQVAHATAH